MIKSYFSYDHALLILVIKYKLKKEAQKNIAVSDLLFQHGEGLLQIDINNFKNENIDSNLEIIFNLGDNCG